MIGRIVDGLFGRDRYFFWKINAKSKLLRLKCLLLGGHTHAWKKCHGGGEGFDALICTRCRCHVAEFRQSQETGGAP